MSNRELTWSIPVTLGITVSVEESPDDAATAALAEKVRAAVQKDLDAGFIVGGNSETVVCELYTELPPAGSWGPPTEEEL